MSFAPNGVYEDEAPKGGKRMTAKKTATKKGNDPVETYIAEQTPDKRALLERLRAVVDKAVPDATTSIKWGVPFYQRNGKNICALASFKEYVGINIFAPPDVLVDPKRRLEGAGKTNRMYKVRTAADVDAAAITRWLKAAVAANG